MYKFDIFENIGMSIDWFMIYWGIQNGVLNKDSAQEYVCKKIEQNECISEEESKLLCEGDLVYILQSIEKISGFSENIKFNIEQAKEKVCVAIIIFLRQTEVNIGELLEKIDAVYTDFDYPEDMESFIFYMPVKGEYVPELHSLDENRIYLLNQLDDYIDRQVRKYQLKLKK